MLVIPNMTFFWYFQNVMVNKIADSLFSFYQNDSKKYFEYNKNVEDTCSQIIVRLLLSVEFHSSISPSPFLQSFHW